jgi:hypothetical protein
MIRNAPRGAGRGATQQPGNMSKTLGYGLIMGLAFAATSAGAACPLRDITVDGAVVDAGGQTVAGALIETRWIEKNPGQLTNQRQSGADGRFQVHVQFDPFAGRSFTGKDRCDFPLERIELAVTREGYLPLTQRFEPDKLPAPLVLTLEPAR